ALVYHLACTLLKCAVIFLYLLILLFSFFFFSSRRRHTRSYGDWSSDVCSSDLAASHKAPWPAGSGGASSASPRESAAQTTRSRRSEERRVGKECRSRGSPYQ